jgi:hypothetical protein
LNEGDFDIVFDWLAESNLRYFKEIKIDRNKAEEIFREQRLEIIKNTETKIITWENDSKDITEIWFYTGVKLSKVDIPLSTFKSIYHPIKEIELKFNIYLKITFEESNTDPEVPRITKTVKCSRGTLEYI